MIRTGLILCTLLLSAYTWSQEDPAKQNLIEQRIELIAEQYEDEDIDFTTLFDELSYYYDHQLDLNLATKDQLASLFLLTDRQIIELLSYREKYGKFLTVYEIAYIYTLDESTVDLILPFVTVGSSTEAEVIPIKERFTDGRHQLFIRYQRVLEDMEGYMPIEDSVLAQSPNKRYLGSPDKLYMRYRYQFRDNMSIGLTAEKDAGEEFFKGTQKNGFDFYSAHLYLKDLGKIKRLAIGDYQAQFGQGLAIWSGLAFGKSAIVRNMKRNGQGIRPYSSVDENLFLRGAAATLGFGKFEFSAFGSYNKIDGNRVINQDTSSFDEEVILTSFQQSGYHRTPGEFEDKDVVNSTHAGSHIAYKTEHVNIGMSGLYTRYDTELNRNLSNYNQFDFEGNENVNVSLDYNIFTGPFNFFGESAISKSGGMAHLAGVMSEIDSRVRFIAIHRRYDRNYHTLMGNGMGEGGNTSNEIGTIMGVEAKLHKYVDMVAYVDYYRWNWLSYQKDALTNGQDYLTQFNIKPNRNTLIYIRYKWENKPSNHDFDNVAIRYPIAETKQQFRIHFDRRVDNIKFRSRFEWSQFDPNDGELENGYMVYQDIIWKLRKTPLNVAVRYALFQTDSYETRIYAYETDVLYAFSIPAYYYRGSRAYLTLKYSPSRKVDIWLRWGQFFYNDREVLSSGLNEIQGNTRTEVKAQVRLKF